MGTSSAIAVEPLVRRRIFATEEQAARELVRDHVLRQIASLQREVTRFERKYGVHFEHSGWMSRHYIACRSRMPMVS